MKTLYTTTGLPKPEGKIPKAESINQVMIRKLKEAEFEMAKRGSVSY